MEDEIKSEFKFNKRQQECMRSQTENDAIDRIYSDKPIHCIKCNIETPTTKFEIVHKQITQVNRSSSNLERYINTSGKIIRGRCTICNTKKRIYDSNDNYDLKLKQLRGFGGEEGDSVCVGCG
jgi:hypothetical protein